MKKVLLVTDVSFWEKCSGHRMRISALIAYLASHVQLTVVNTGPAPENIEQILSAEYSAEFHILEKKRYLDSNSYGRKLKVFLKNRHFDTLIIEYIHSSYFLNFLREDVKLILDAHDIISERTAQFKRFNYAGALYELPRETENEIFNVYDKIMVLCAPDYEQINTMIGPGKALLCPHPHQIHHHSISKEVKNIVFIASAYLPNKDGINFFINNCWPAISEKSAMQLSIYGTVAEGVVINNQKNISIKGFEPDINKIYEEADIVINPVRFGAGLKIKNVEALAYGRPLVTTPHGARGIEAGQDHAFLVANDAIGFINAIASLIESNELRTYLSHNAMTFIAENFNVNTCFEPLLEEINKNQ
jgi:glycosyltransferase involved in cell wall biosynthesis